MECATRPTVALWCFLFLGPPACAAGKPAQTQPPSAAVPASAPSRSELTAEERADIFMARKNYEGAVDYYQRALRLQNSPTDSARLWNKIGIAYQQDNNYSAARKAYKRSIHFDQKFSDPWNNLGTTYFLSNKFKQSLKYYEHAIALEPKSALFHLNLGTSFSRMKKYDQAVKEYQVALTLDPNVLAQHGYGGSVIQPQHPDVDYFYNMAKVFASLGRTDEAIRYLRRAFEEGFKNLKRLDADPDFRKISKDPSYVALRKSPPVGIKED